MGNPSFSAAFFLRSSSTILIFSAAKSMSLLSRVSPR
jgi:hypothetical protein